MEFGTAPATRADCDYPNRADFKTDLAFYKEVYRRSEFYRNIFDWVNLKGAQDAKPSEKYAIAWRMCRIIAKNGLKPRPFFRPAFYYMCEHMQEWWDRG